ncbi:hypothetical protein ACQZ5N_21640 [Agrobacterium sp. 22-221-1]
MFYQLLLFPMKFGLSAFNPRELMARILADRKLEAVIRVTAFRQTPAEFGNGKLNADLGVGCVQAATGARKAGSRRTVIDRCLQVG